MKTLLILIGFLLLSILPAKAQMKDTVITDDMDDYIEQSTVEEYIVVAGASTDFNALDLLAKKISTVTNINYRNDLMYDKKRGMILPDTSSDDIYAGSYFPVRRYPEELISIDMKWYFSEHQGKDGDKTMIIVTGVFGNKEEAKKNLELIKKVVPTAYIKSVNIYLGCMH